MTAATLPARPVFTTKWALQRLPGPNRQEQVEQTALDHMRASYRAWLSDRRRLPTDLPRWALMVEAALEHACDVHDERDWTDRRIAATTAWLMGAADEIERAEKP